MNTPKHSFLRSQLIKLVGKAKFKNQQKIFGIGFNKTGTTSLRAALESLGYTVAFQETAERAFLDCLKGDHRSLIDYCKYGGNAFQDIPFSAPNIFKVLDENFPGSKFILTHRDSTEQWYQSLCNFHARRFGDGESPPNAEMMKNANYNSPGLTYKTFKGIFDTPDDDLYNKEVLSKAYEKHNQTVIEYFKDRPKDLLVLNPSDSEAMTKLGAFLNKEVSTKAFPKTNTTESYK